ncbi:OmpA family protein [Lewinella sp. 4G2]|uniref:OmpA family protein n=1 Tax=Lewinella sp. 4G2 TaxID=1803372 RepID=UPI0007B46833|nr:OmpA family protein [Lewinella sp. 4G2]OAV46236.1 hypothetical protein A3850_018445 [Lewinella sp. 4G2]
MKLLHTLSLAVLLPLSYGVQAQGTPVPATDDSKMETTDMTIEELADVAAMEGKKTGSMFEFGLRPTYSWVAGDVDATGGYGLGIHARKAFDHIFSVRLDGLYAATSGDNESGRRGNRRFESRWTSGTVFAVATLNNLKYEGGQRNTNIYLMGGAGGNTFKVASQKANADNFAEDEPLDNERNDILDREFGAHWAAGAGVAFRISSRFNVGLEYQALIPLGKRADLIDGYKASNFRDVQNAASLSLNFNIGNAATQMEPRYWENPFNGVKKDLVDMDGKVNAATNDADGDGVVDAIDQEANTPMGAPVDTKGRLLDSDGDGVADYKDLEPFFPPRAGETVDANGVVTNRIDKPITEDRIQEMIDASISKIKADLGPTSTTVVTNRGEMYLPIIYFPLNQATVKYADYGTLSSVARVMKGNPDMRLIVRGYTDKVGSDSYNRELSYRRASNVISHLVNQHGISRDRLILQYRGEDENLVPQDRSVVNRRVEFLSAEAGAREDGAPAGSSNRRGY